MSLSFAFLAFEAHGLLVVDLVIFGVDFPFCFELLFGWTSLAAAEEDGESAAGETDVSDCKSSSLDVSSYSSESWTLFALSASSPWFASSSLSSQWQWMVVGWCGLTTNPNYWTLLERGQHQNQMEQTFFSQVSPKRGSDILIFFFCFSRVQAEFLSYCFPDIHSYKLILIVRRKFVVNCRIFLLFFHKEWGI